MVLFRSLNLSAANQRISRARSNNLASPVAALRRTFLMAIAGVCMVFCITPLYGSEPDAYATANELGLMKGFPPPKHGRVDRSNAILGAPQNRWSYQHMRRVYPSAGVRPADASVQITREIDLAISKLAVAREDGSLADMPTFLTETFTDALVVVQGDKIVFEHYANGMTADQPHQMMSVTKSFAGLLALIAVEEGQMSEDDLVTQWLPELNASTAFSEGAKIGHVLDMTNSMAFTELYDDPNSDIRKYSRVLGLEEPLPGEVLPDNLYDFLMTLERDSYNHGEAFVYQTPKADAVNWITNRVTNRSFEDDLHETIWSKIGTEGETYVLLDRNGSLFAGGGLNATPNNLVRFAVMMLNDGHFNGQQVVPKSVIRKLRLGGDKKQFSNSLDAKGVFGDGHWSYRAQWWVRHTPGRESYSAIGINGQWIVIDPERKIAIIKQSSQPEAYSSYYDDYTVNAVDAVTSYLAAGK